MATGCLEFRGKNKAGEKTWRLIVSGAKDTDGKQERKTRTVHGDKKEASLALSEFVAEINSGKYVKPTKLTLNDFFDHWVETYGPDLAERTLYRYQQIFDARIRNGLKDRNDKVIIKALGPLQLEKITSEHLTEFYNNLAKDGARQDGKHGPLATKTIHQHKALLSSMFSDAMEWKYLKSDPTLIRSKREKRKQQKKLGTNDAAITKNKAFDESQLILVLEALKSADAKYRTAINLLASTGMRRGELCALQWEDINLDTGTIKIEHSMAYVPKKGLTRKETKTEGSKRTINIQPGIVKMLSKFKAEQKLQTGEKWKETWYIFDRGNKISEPIHPDTLSSWFPEFIKAYNSREAFNTEISTLSNKLSDENIVELEKLKEQYLKLNISSLKTAKEKLAVAEDSIIKIIGQESFKRIQQVEKIPPMNLHGLRHSFATIQSNRGESLQNIGAALGHSGTEITSKIYNHFLGDTAEKVANRLSDLFPEEQQAK